ncbi:MAG: hypothetical protein ABI569_13160 [Casimicrobiaceae bacterium]
MIHRLRLSGLVCGAVLAAFAGPAVALSPQRTFVATGGNDANPCALTAPCRSFGAAIAVVAAGGEVIVLDSGGYGGVSINQSVSIISPSGVYAGVTVFSGAGITVNGSASDVVVLRGLTLVGLGGSVGISSNSLGTTRIESCAVSGMTGTGISTTTPGKVFVTDTIVRNNFDGIDLSSSTTPGYAALDRVRLEGNQNGLWVFNARASMRDSESTGNLTGVVVGSFNASDTPSLDVESSVISNNSQSGIQGANAVGHGTFSVANSSITNNGSGGIGVGIGGGASDAARVSNTTIIGNNAGVGAFVVSVGGNLLEGNNFGNTFSTTLPKK